MGWQPALECAVLELYGLPPDLGGVRGYWLTPRSRSGRPGLDRRPAAKGRAGRL